MLSISTNANKNYLAKIVALENVRKHEGADRLQVATIDFNNVIIGLDMKEGDVCVFFPVECQINVALLSHINGFHDKEMNKDKEKQGFFELKCRVKAIKLRGEKSMGFVIPIADLESFVGDKIDDPVGTEFNYLNDMELVKKYEIYKPEPRNRNGKVEKRISRLVDGQFHFHIDTENLRKSAHQIKPDDRISVTYKVHGTSAIFANVLVKSKLSLYERIIQSLFRVNLRDTAYDILYSSRKVVKNEYETKDKPGFYGTDIWKDVCEEIKHLIPTGYTVYGEILGFTRDGGAIQKDYDYGCQGAEHKFQVYRITNTNADGMVLELSTEQMVEFCEKTGLKTVHLFYCGLAKDMYPDIADSDRWSVDFVKRLEADYNDKDCFMCTHKVPEEGVVVRKEQAFSFEAYKLKSFSFLEYESKQLDAGIIDTESAN